MSQVSYAAAYALQARRDPDTPAIVCEGEQARRGDFHRRSNQLARAYAEHGVGPGDFVTLALPNGIEFLEACAAVWKLGAVPQPISARLPEGERRAILDEAKPTLVVGAAPGSYGGSPCVPVGFDAAQHSDEDLPDQTSPHCQAMTSGGSTGRPKLIVDALPGLCDPEAPPFRMKSGDRVLVPGPLYHAGPFLIAKQTLTSGGTVVLMRRFDASEALRLIEEHRVSWVLFVPTMMQRIWRLPEAERQARDLSSLETIMCSGAPSSPWLKRAWIEWMGPEKIWESYGGTERLGGTQISGTDWLEHPGSVGKPTGGREVRILDRDGVQLPPGEIGEVYWLPPGGPGSTYHYVGASPETVEGGWETLGDLGYVDEDGYLFLTDRRTDMIVTGGANVYPAEVEAALDAHGSVRSSAAIGLPDDDLGQRVHAIVDATACIDEGELLDHLAQHLASYKIPRSFEFVNEPLRDDAGKVRRSALRQARLPGSG